VLRVHATRAREIEDHRDWAQSRDDVRCNNLPARTQIVLRYVHECNVVASQQAADQMRRAAAEAAWAEGEAARLAAAVEQQLA
jgi:hypothetical protein